MVCLKMEEAMKINPELQFIMISGHGSIDTAVAATKKGAFDFIQKPPDLNRLLVSVRNALDKTTRGDSPKRKYVPVVLSVICEEDIQLLTQGANMSKITEKAIVRMIREAYQQGGILSSRDIGLITLRQPSWASSVRRRFEAQNDCTLPHTGALHDMGSTVSHKAAIIRKVVLEKKDPSAVARECNHTQAAVDRYLKDYHRVKTLYNLNHDVEFIHLTTQIAKHVIVQYIKIIDRENI